MKTRISVLASLIGTGLLLASSAFAQDQQPMQTTPSAQSQPMMPSNTPPAPQPTQPMAAPQGNSAAAGSAGTGSATFSAAQNQVTVNSTTGTTPSTASPPSFEQLSGGSKFITQDQANAYPPLANDFIHVAGHSDRITKAQYEHWLQHLN